MKDWNGRSVEREEKGRRQIGDFFQNKKRPCGVRQAGPVRNFTPMSFDLMTFDLLIFHRLSTSPVI
jgi:hypothetical protein